MVRPSRFVYIGSPTEAASGYFRRARSRLPGCRLRRPTRTLDMSLGGLEATMSQARPILFATDGSPSAAEARREAFELAKLLQAPLVVVSVAHVTLPAVGYAGYGYSDVVADITKTERARVAEVLAEVAAAAEEAGLACSTLAGEGIVVEEICSMAAERDAQLIVVGSHGWGAARRLFSGSVSTGLVHSAPCPVLVVRSPHPEEDGTSPGSVEGSRRRLHLHRRGSGRENSAV
jgi:nucleotide-binding universal stress UspA family protein